MVRNAIIYDLGRNEADRIADHFNQLRSKGSYENEVQRWARERGYDKD